MINITVCTSFYAPEKSSCANLLFPVPDYVALRRFRSGMFVFALVVVEIHEFY